MTLDKRINAFVLLGDFLKQFTRGLQNESLSTLNKEFHDDFEQLISQQKALNGWFVKENVLDALDAISNTLTIQELNKWLANYTLTENNKRVGVIMAGNIPLVGFYDFLSVLITGNILIAKLSSGDNTLLKKIGEVIVAIDSDFQDKIYFVDKLENFDAVIATGSNNSARYFNYYFGKYPHIIRKNRNSVAIINKNDTAKELNELGKDVFQYFGLGCRNVSKLYFPIDYPINQFFEAIFEDYQHVIQNNKYANNYDYNKAVYLLASHQLLDNDFLLLKEDKSLTSPVGVLNYEYYSDIKKLDKELNEMKEQLQCVVSSKNTPVDSLAFGTTQAPQLNDYADGIDTVQFLIDLE